MITVHEHIDSLRSLSQIFTTSNFNKVVRNNDLRYTVSKLKKHVTRQSSVSTYENLIQSVYLELQEKYRCEYFYKNALLEKYLLKKYSLRTTTVLNEFKVGGSIADFVLLNGEARIFEIKTDLDGLEKLSKQLKDYSQFANKVYVVASSKHTNKLMQEYGNSSIGIIEFTDIHSLKELKAADDNVNSFEHTTIFKTLRKNEYLEVVHELCGYVPDVPNTKIFRECLELSKTVDITTFQAAVFNKLKERKLKCPDLLKSNKIPSGLKHICYTLDLSETEYFNLYKFLSKPI